MITTRTIARLANKKSQTLLHFSNMWADNTGEGNPVLDIIKYRRLALNAWLWTICTVVMSAVIINLAAPSHKNYLTLFLLNLLMIPLVFLCRYLFGLGQGHNEEQRKLSDNAKGFMCTIGFVEVLMSRHLKDVARCKILFSHCEDVENLWHIKAHRSKVEANFPCKIEESVISFLEKSGKEVAYLQSFPWLKQKADAKRDEMTGAHRLLANLLQISKSLDPFFPYKEVLQN